MVGYATRLADALVKFYFIRIFRIFEWVKLETSNFVHRLRKYCPMDNRQPKRVAVKVT